MYKCNDIISDALAEQDGRFEILAMKRRNAYIVMYTGYVPIHNAVSRVM